MRDRESPEILLVEDNPHDADLALRALRKRDISTAVAVVEDGQQALDFIFARGQYTERAEAPQPKVVLLDVKLPKVSGLEVLQAVKNDKRTRNIPVVMVTSSLEDSDVRASYEMGANSYVVKPIEFEEFMKAIGDIGVYWLAVNRPSE